MFDRYFDILDGWYRSNRKDVIVAFVWLYRAAILLAVCVVLFSVSGCRSQQVSERLHYHDSTIYHHRYDTVRVFVYDSTTMSVQQAVTTDEGTSIEFVGEGGSVNLQTGEMSGVQKMHIRKQTDSSTVLESEWHCRVESLQATSDSLRQVLKTYKIAGEKKTDTADIRPARSAYDKFCSAFFWCVLIAGIIALAWWLTDKRYGWWTVLKALMRI